MLQLALFDQGNMRGQFELLEEGRAVFWSQALQLRTR